MFQLNSKHLIFPSGMHRRTQISRSQLTGAGTTVITDALASSEGRPSHCGGLKPTTIANRARLFTQFSQGSLRNIHYLTGGTQTNKIVTFG